MTLLFKMNNFKNFHLWGGTRGHKLCFYEMIININKKKYKKNL